LPEDAKTMPGAPRCGWTRRSRRLLFPYHAPLHDRGPHYRWLNDILAVGTGHRRRTVRSIRFSRFS